MTAETFIAIVNSLVDEPYNDIEQHPGVYRRESNEAFGEAFNQALKVYGLLDKKGVKDDS